MMKCRTRQLMWMVFGFMCAACRSPKSPDGFADTETSPSPDGGWMLGDGGDDGGVRSPCGPKMDPDLGLLPDNSPYKGGEDSADVVVNIFSNLKCPNCARLAEIVDILWERPEYRSRFRLYFRHVPVSFEVHAAAVAVFHQGNDNFWALQDEIFLQLRENGEYMSMDDIRAFADDVLQLDMAQFEADLISDETASRLSSDREIADALGVTGTPTVFVCDERIKTSDLETVISEFF